jgi:lipopolysaccharide export LptBFGC system permease protein LptF
MSLSEIVIKIIGIVLAIVGFALLLSTVGLNVLGIGVDPIWLAILLGFIFLGCGIFIIRGGNISI